MGKCGLDCVWHRPIAESALARVRYVDTGNSRQPARIPRPSLIGLPAQRPRPCCLRYHWYWRLAVMAGSVSIWDSLRQAAPAVQMDSPVEMASIRTARALRVAAVVPVEDFGGNATSGGGHGGNGSANGLSVNHIHNATPIACGNRGAGADGVIACVDGGGAGAGGLTKTGAGPLTLSGRNTYSGPTNVDAGTLRAGAAAAFSSASDFNVATGTTLGARGARASAAPASSTAMPRVAPTMSPRAITASPLAWSLTSRRTRCMASASPAAAPIGIR